MQKVIRGEWLEEDRIIKEMVAVAYSEHKVFGVDYRKKIRGHQTQNNRKPIMV